MVRGESLANPALILVHGGPGGARRASSATSTRRLTKASMVVAFEPRSTCSESDRRRDARFPRAERVDGQQACRNAEIGVSWLLSGIVSEQACWRTGSSSSGGSDTFLSSFPRAPQQVAPQASHRASSCCFDRPGERARAFAWAGCSLRCTATTSATCRPSGPGSDRRPATLRPSATYGARRSGERTRGRCRRLRASRCRRSARVLGLGSWRSR